MMSQQQILLESGTNEVEIAHFDLGGRGYGVNVEKIREFIPQDTVEISRTIETHEAVRGMFLLRGQTIPLIDLKMLLEQTGESVSGRQVIIVTQFNDMINGFMADAIKQIHRLSWKDIQPMNNYLNSYGTYFTGTVSVGGEEILLLDFEQIIDEIFPHRGKKSSRDQILEEATDLVTRRSLKRLILAEDSHMMRRHITSKLKGSGYDSYEIYNNGEEAFQAMKNAVENDPDESPCDLVITDIEMPRMDGLTLCREIRKTLKLEELPVLVFSSLINEQVRKKCEQVGANGTITKPQLDKLVGLIDSFLLP